MKKIILGLFLCINGMILFAQPQQHNSYTVKNGDTLESIAKVYRVSPNDLKNVNPSLANGLKAGMLLVIPTSNVKYFSTKQPSGFSYHTVDDKETLYGLAQKYNISQDDIRRYNIILYTKDLKKGQELTIPVYKDANKEIVRGKEGLVRYIVKPGEGKWRIAQNFGISQEELEKMNPKMPSSLKEGMEIWVPAGKSGVPDANPTNGSEKNLVLYQVEKGEGFMSLERKFGLSEKDIVRLNPGLKDGIKAESQIWIPKNNFMDYVATQGGVSQSNISDANDKIRTNMKTSNVKNISFVIPFKVNNLQPKDIVTMKQKLQKDKLANISTDLYSGALIAMDSLQKLGFSFNINVYDSEGSIQGIKSIVKSETLANSQVIIGPFAPQVFNYLSEEIQSSDVALLAPLSNKNIEFRSNVFLTVPPTEVQQQKMITFINQKYPNANIVLLSDAKSKDLNEKLLTSFANAQNVDNISGIKNALKKEATNIVFVSSNDVVYLSDAIRILYNTAGLGKKTPDYNIIMATLDKGDAYDHSSISNIALSGLKFTYPAVNRYAGESNGFIKKYYETYKISPSRYAFRGFDLMMDAVLRTSISGNFVREANIGETSYQENKFLYVKKGNGYENQGIYILRYDDLQVTEIY